MDNRNALKQFGAGLGGLPFPLLADFFPHGKVSQDYDTFNDEGGTSRRTVVMVDKEGVIRWTKLYTSPPDMGELLEVAKSI